MCGDSKINVPITIAIPENESANILADDVRIIESEVRHFIMSRTKIKGETKRNISVNAANGHKSSGDVDAK